MKRSELIPGDVFQYLYGGGSRSDVRFYVDSLRDGDKTKFALAGLSNPSEGDMDTEVVLLNERPKRKFARIVLNGDATKPRADWLKYTLNGAGRAGSAFFYESEAEARDPAHDGQGEDRDVYVVEILEKHEIRTVPVQKTVTVTVDERVRTKIQAGDL